MLIYSDTYYEQAPVKIYETELVEFTLDVELDGTPVKYYSSIEELTNILDLHRYMLTSLKELVKINMYEVWLEGDVHLKVTVPMNQIPGTYTPHYYTDITQITAIVKLYIDSLPKETDNETA